MMYWLCKVFNVVFMVCVLFKSFIVEYRIICCICGNVRIEFTIGDAYVFESVRVMWEIFIVFLVEVGVLLLFFEIFVVFCMYMLMVVVYMLSVFCMLFVVAFIFREYNFNVEFSKVLNGSVVRCCFSNILSCLVLYVENVMSVGLYLWVCNLGSMWLVRLIALEIFVKTYRDFLSAGKVNSLYKIFWFCVLSWFILLSRMMYILLFIEVIIFFNVMIFGILLYFMDFTFGVRFLDVIFSLSWFKMILKIFLVLCMDM